MTAFRLLGAVLMPLLLVACAGASSTLGGLVSATATSAKKDGLQCQRVPVNGTRMTEKVCTTAAQREASTQVATDAQSELDMGTQQVSDPEGA
ncbi:hypothetical protein H2508_07150 [Parahaliea sp. F7430]|uniref:Secreted protein n=2 Tax=Sediminihaliea albiluteola TaxID=2758564 RepID=A0A7W2TVV2_9GAMM|nr:hypothetical protein [Sediminihaliea albiluteola]